jgi:hypothetical protein
VSGTGRSNQLLVQLPFFEGSSCSLSLPLPPPAATAHTGYDKYGYDTKGYDKYGYDKYGYNKGGLYKFEDGKAATSGKKN